MNWNLFSVEFYRSNDFDWNNLKLANLEMVLMSFSHFNGKQNENVTILISIQIKWIKQKQKRWNDCDCVYDYAWQNEKKMNYAYKLTCIFQ